MKKILYIDLDGVLANYDKAFLEYKKKTPQQPYPQSQYGFYMELEPIVDGIETVNFLSDKFDIWFLTAPSFKNPMCYTEKAYWINKYFGVEWLEKLIICSNKSLLMGDYLIDDHIYGRGQENFKSELIQFGSDKFKNWTIVSDYLFTPVSQYNDRGVFVSRSRIDNFPIFKLDNKYWKEDKTGVKMNIDTETKYATNLGSDFKL